MKILESKAGEVHGFQLQTLQLAFKARYDLESPPGSHIVQEIFCLFHQMGAGKARSGSAAPTAFHIKG